MAYTQLLKVRKEKAEEAEKYLRAAGIPIIRQWVEEQTYIFKIPSSYTIDEIRRIYEMKAPSTQPTPQPETQEEYGHWVDPKTGLGYSGPRQDPSHVPAEQYRPPEPPPDIYKTFYPQKEEQPVSAKPAELPYYEARYVSPPSAEPFEIPEEKAIQRTAYYTGDVQIKPTGYVTTYEMTPYLDIKTGKFVKGGERTYITGLDISFSPVTEMETKEREFRKEAQKKLGLSKEEWGSLSKSVFEPYEKKTEIKFPQQWSGNVVALPFEVLGKTEEFFAKAGIGIGKTFELLTKPSFLKGTKGLVEHPEIMMEAIPSYTYSTVTYPFSSAKAFGETAAGLLILKGISKITPKIESAAIKFHRYMLPKEFKSVLKIKSPKVPELKPVGMGKIDYITLHTKKGIYTRGEIPFGIKELQLPKRTKPIGLINFEMLSKPTKEGFSTRLSLESVTRKKIDAFKTFSGKGKMIGKFIEKKGEPKITLSKAKILEQEKGFVQKTFRRGLGQEQPRRFSNIKSMMIKADETTSLGLHKVEERLSQPLRKNEIWRATKLKKQWEISGRGWSRGEKWFVIKEIKPKYRKIEGIDIQKTFHEPLNKEFYEGFEKTTKELGKLRKQTLKYKEISEAGLHALLLRESLKFLEQRKQIVSLLPKTEIKRTTPPSLPPIQLNIPKIIVFPKFRPPKRIEKTMTMLSSSLSSKKSKRIIIKIKQKPKKKQKTDIGLLIGFERMGKPTTKNILDKMTKQKQITSVVQIPKTVTRERLTFKPFFPLPKPIFETPPPPPPPPPPPVPTSRWIRFKLPKGGKYRRKKRKYTYRLIIHPLPKPEVLIK